MGYIRHQAIIVTGSNKEQLSEVHRRAKGIFHLISEHGSSYESLISEVVPHVTNGGASFFVAPDGSKEGWETSNLCDLAREKLVAYLGSPDATGLYWALLDVGGDSNIFKVIAHSGEDS